MGGGREPNKTASSPVKRGRLSHGSLVVPGLEGNGVNTLFREGFPDGVQASDGPDEPGSMAPTRDRDV